MSAVARACSIDELRRIARKRLPRAIFGFIDGGAEDELTLRDNRAAFERPRAVGGKMSVLLDSGARRAAAASLSPAHSGRPLWLHI